MGEQSRYQVEQRANAAIYIEAGSGPGRWVESESQDALGRLDARLNPDHGTARPPTLVADGDALEHRSLIAFSEGGDSAVAPDAAAEHRSLIAFSEGGDSAVAPDAAADASQVAWDGLRPTEF